MRKGIVGRFGCEFQGYELISLAEPVYEYQRDKNRYLTTRAV